MAYRKRLVLLLILDSLILSTAIFIASWIAYPYEAKMSPTSLIISAGALLTFYFLFAIYYKLYKKVWAYASVGELVIIVKSITFSIVATTVVQFFVSDFEIYKRALLITWMLLVLLIGGSRFTWRILRDSLMNKVGNKRRTLIIGAGAAGAMIARQLTTGNNPDLHPVGFIDDSPSKQKMELFNLPIFGKIDDIDAVVHNHSIEHIIIAIPSLPDAQLNKIVTMCHKTKVKTQILPKVEDLLTGKVTVSQLKDVEVEDLLGREPVKLDNEAIQQDVQQKTIMVTGAGGSIGSELCRQLVKFEPETLLLVGHGEFSIYTIEMELRDICKEKGIVLKPLIGDIRDKKRMKDMMNYYRPTIIYHAAAHKHVPLMEYNPHEAVKNNIIGTKNVAEAAVQYSVQTFVLISTDKAVNPTSVMGATKRATEMVIQRLSESQSETTFTAVRFGNVLGSRGSVIPLFKKQIQRGGPVTVTDANMTRYFMTIPEASRLVIQAGTLAKGGEIFVLDMGEPVKIMDLAKNLIRLSGYTEEEIPIQCVGMRPGEKLYEELLGEKEILPGQVYDKIYVGKTSDVNGALLDTFINEFEDYTNEELKKEIFNLMVHDNAALLADVESNEVL